MITLGQGIANESEAGQEGWAVWIHSEEQIAQGERDARGLSRESRRAEEVSGEGATLPGAIAPTPATEADKPVASSVPGQKVITISVAYRVGLLTMVMVGLCLAVQVLREAAGADEGVLRELFMTEIVFDGNYFKWEPGLREIFQGEFWRVFTPVMVHNDWLHLLLNMLWLLDLGSMIERRQGTRRLGLLIVVTAVLSNFGQYFLYDANFCGMSGVVYGLLGYVWMKGRFKPASGLYLQPHTLVMMLVWFFLCLGRCHPQYRQRHARRRVGGGDGVGHALEQRHRWRRQS